MTSSRRVVLLGPWPPPYGGVSVHVERLYELLSADGFEPRMLSPDIRARSGDLYPLSWGGRRSLAGAAAIPRVAGRGGLVHNHSAIATYPTRHLELVLLATRASRNGWLDTVHDQTLIHRFEGFTDGGRRLFIKAMTKSAHIIAIGNELRDFLVGIGVSPSKIDVGQPLLPPSLDSPTLEPELQAFVTSHSPLWVTIGAFIPLYDFATVARAFRNVVHAEPGAGLTVVSGRFATDRTFEKSVRALGDDLGDRVMFLEDIPNEQVRTLLRSASLLVRGAQHESFGLSRAEAIMAGVPVVATDSGETKWVTVYEHGNAASLLDASRRARLRGEEALLAGAAYYNEMASRSYEVILGVYERLGVRPRAGRGAK